MNQNSIGKEIMVILFPRYRKFVTCDHLSKSL